MNKWDVLAVTFLFCVALYAWTLPIQANPYPFGEGDAAWHFSIGDYISTHDTTISKLPIYISLWYYNYNPVLGPHALEYPPPNHVNYALMSAFGGERSVPIHIYRAISSFLGAFAVFLLVRRLYGLAPALVAGFALIFSLREMMLYMFGQQPSLLSFTFVPVILYSYSQFLLPWLKGEFRPVYFYATVLLLLGQWLLHIQGLMLSAAILTVYTLWMLGRNLKFTTHFKKHIQRHRLIHFAIALMLILAVAAPTYLIYFAVAGTSTSEAPFSSPLRLLQWGLTPKSVEGSFPPDYVLFNSTYPLWMLPLILAGIIFLMIRRSDNDILILSWLIGMYLALHLDVFTGASSSRIARSLVAEGQLFFVLMALGAWFLTGTVLRYVNLSKQLKLYARIGIPALLIILIFSTVGSDRINLMKSAYQDPMRITSPEADAAQWLDQNVPWDSLVYDVGTITYPKTRWLLALSQRHVRAFTGDIGGGAYPLYISKYYMLFDYSDLLRLANQQEQVSSLQGFEQAITIDGAQLVYNTQPIRIYDVTMLAAENQNATALNESVEVLNETG